MSDIAERLVRTALEDVTGYMLGEASDEICRLRAELAAEREAHKKTHDTMNEIIIENTAARERVENFRALAASIYTARESALLGLLREAHVKMVENNLWRNLRARIGVVL